MQPIHLKSLDMGCVTFMERYFTGGKITEENFENAKQAAHTLIADVSNAFLCFDWENCLGASGTPQAITEILVTQGISDSIRLDYLYNLQQQCVDCDDIASLEIEGLTDARRTIFPSGLCILIALFEELNIQEMQISGGALREGLIYGMLDNMQQNDRRAQTLEHLIDRFHIEPEHANRVKNLSLALFKQAQKQLSLSKLDCEPELIAASMLSELGMHIEYKLHHIHGAYILNHLPMVGYTQQQKSSIRALVQSHRQDIDLANFTPFHPDVRSQLFVLTRILRLACILSIRRKDNLITDFNLVIENDVWQLTFPKGWLKSHPLIDAELANEKWQQHKVGWKLLCN
jgi:exopolyphosphatase/guanosine-5'-triphosphate,3'-diphosphate pyrophosphatase